MPFPLRIDATTLPALIFGGILLIVAIVMGVLIWRARNSLDPAVANDDGSRLHADRQFRRRIQVAIMLGMVGILIPLGDQLDQLFVKRPVFFFVWVLCLFALVIWMVLIALGDWLSTFAYSGIVRSHLMHERNELEQEIRRYHASKNGHSLDDGEEAT